MDPIQPRLLPLACFILLPLAMACEREPEAEPMPADAPPATMEDAAPPADLMSASDRYIAAWNADDAAQVAAFFTDDATVTVNDDVYSGRDEIVAEWVEPGVAIVHNLEVTEQITERVGEDYRSAGTYTHIMDPPDAEPFEVSGRYTATWTLDADGEWRILSSEVHQDEQPEG